MPCPPHRPMPPPLSSEVGVSNDRAVVRTPSEREPPVVLLRSSTVYTDTSLL